MVMEEFDRSTESDRERILMEKIRGGDVLPEEVEAHSLPFFLKIQIQTRSVCNGSCSMCPWPETAATLPQGTMAESVFRRIVDQLAGQGVERTGLFLMNEPLLDDRLEKFTTHLKRVVPETEALIFTNGLLLTRARAEALAAAGLDEVNISVVGFTPSVYRKVMGIDHHRVLENLKEVAKSSACGALGKLRMKVIALEMPGVRDGVDAFEAETGLDVFFKPVTNRAGNIVLRDLGMASPVKKEPRACQRPFVKAYILFNGDMVLCNCDWRRTTCIGNVKDQTLETVWTSPRLMDIRRHHVRGVFPDGMLCRGCDYA